MLTNKQVKFLVEFMDLKNYVPFLETSFYNADLKFTNYQAAEYLDTSAGREAVIDKVFNDNETYQIALKVYSNLNDNEKASEAFPKLVNALMTMGEKTLITYGDGRKGYILTKNLSECPKCKKQSVRSKEMFEGGGVVCITPDCSYWFCT